MENHQAESQKEIKNDKYLTRVLIAVALLILGAVFFIMGLDQPKVSSEEISVSKAVKSVAVEKTSAKSEKKTTAKNKAPTIKTTNKSVSFPINLNTCSAEDLMEINNVGETRANAIIAYRDYLGGYTSVDQLKNISGIGDSVYASIEPYVTV